MLLKLVTRSFLFIDATDSKNNKVLCFVHTLSPVKNAANSGRQYFHCTLQTENKTVRAVCFSPEKHQTFQSSEDNKSPLKLENCKQPESDGQDLIVTKYTKITPLARDQLSFQYSDELTQKSKITDISSLTKIAKEQLVSGVKTLVKHDNTELKKQELVIRDNKGSIELVLWNEYVDLLETNKTYILTNLRLKESKFGQYVNTPKSEKFSFEETTAFTEPLVAIEENVKELTTSTVMAKIIGVQSATRNLLCVSCHKKVIQKSGSKIGTCESQGCKLVQKVSACKCNWNVRLLFETTELKKIHLTIFNNHCLQKLLKVEMSLCDLNSTMQDDLVLVLLEFESTYKVTYDNIQNTVSDIEFHEL